MISFCGSQTFLRNRCLFFLGTSLMVMPAPQHSQRKLFPAPFLLFLSKITTPNLRSRETSILLWLLDKPTSLALDTSCVFVVYLEIMCNSAYCRIPYCSDFTSYEPPRTRRFLIPAKVHLTINAPSSQGFAFDTLTDFGLVDAYPNDVRPSFAVGARSPAHRISAAHCP